MYMYSNSDLYMIFFSYTIVYLPTLACYTLL